MYMTWEVFLLFCGVIMQLIILVKDFLKNDDDQNHKNKK